MEQPSQAQEWPPWPWWGPRPSWSPWSPWSWLVSSPSTVWSSLFWSLVNLRAQDTHSTSEFLTHEKYFTHLNQNYLQGFCSLGRWFVSGTVWSGGRIRCGSGGRCRGPRNSSTTKTLRGNDSDLDLRWGVRSLRAHRRHLPVRQEIRSSTNVTLYIIHILHLPEDGVTKTGVRGGLSLWQLLFIWCCIHWFLLVTD